MAREIATDSAAGKKMLGALGFYDNAAPVAFWALDLSLIYLAVLALVKLCPRKDPAETGARPTWVLLAVLTGHVVAAMSAIFGGGVTMFYVWTAATAAVLLLPLARNTHAATPKVASWRLTTGMLVGIVLVALAIPLDMALAVKSGAAIFPEAWFPIIAESWRWQVVGIGGAIAAAILLVARGHVPGRGWWWIAPAYILLLGPSNPLKGIATAYAAEMLGRAGGGWLVRAAFVVLTVGWVVAVSLG